MTPGLRKFALTMHVTSSVGWLGAVGAFLCLAIAGVGSADPQLVRAAYLAMHLTTWFVIIPLGFDFDEVRADSSAGEALRAKLGIRADEMVVGIVGRITPIKK